DSSNASAQTKLAMIRDLMSASSRPVANASNAASPATATKPVAAAPAQPETKPAEAKPESKPEPAKPVVASTAPVAAPAPVVAAESKASAGGSEIGKTLEAWATAWSKKNVKGYLSYYARDFQTPGGEARAAWESERSKRLTKPGNILVSIEGLHVTPESADRATVRFRQHYRSASLKTSSTKVMVMVRQDGRWLIQQERVGK
ncbi:MAG: nuclear transport factor 2 family protein, partial [Rhodocyclaceae bacterium]